MPVCTFRVASQLRCAAIGQHVVKAAASTGHHLSLEQTAFCRRRSAAPRRSSSYSGQHSPALTGFSIAVTLLSFFYGQASDAPAELYEVCSQPWRCLKTWNPIPFEHHLVHQPLHLDHWFRKLLFPRET